jgi:hypothetical protein
VATPATLASIDNGSAMFWTNQARRSGHGSTRLSPHVHGWTLQDGEKCNSQFVQPANSGLELYDKAYRDGAAIQLFSWGGEWYAGGVRLASANIMLTMHEFTKPADRPWTQPHQSKPPTIGNGGDGISNSTTQADGRMLGSLPVRALWKMASEQILTRKHLFPKSFQESIRGYTLE